MSWQTLEISVLESLRQEDHQFRASLGYTARPCYKQMSSYPVVSSGSCLETSNFPQMALRVSHRSQYNQHFARDRKKKKSLKLGVNFSHCAGEKNQCILSYRHCPWCAEEATACPDGISYQLWFCGEQLISQTSVPSGHLDR